MLKNENENGKNEKMCGVRGGEILGGNDKRRVSVMYNVLGVFERGRFVRFLVLNWIWDGCCHIMPSDLHAFLRKKALMHQQHFVQPQPGGRWGWEARLREAEADLSAVKAKRAGCKARRDPATADSGFHTRKSEGWPKSGTNVTHLADVTSLGRDCETRNDVRDREEGCSNSGRDVCSFTVVNSNIRAGGGVTAHSRRGAGVQGFGGERGGRNEVENVKESPRMGGSMRVQEENRGGWGEPQRMPNVGDRWACQVLMEEVRGFALVDLNRRICREFVLIG